MTICGMENECFNDPANYWQCYQADPRSDASRIKSGLRHTANVSCQYFIKGLPGVCKYWDEAGFRCSYERPAGGSWPSGYSGSNCDSLGRRSWCDKYDNGGEEDLNEYVCIAPCMERSGLGNQVPDVDHPLFTPVPRSEILGYNEGRCDGSGLGRGPDGEDKSLEDLLKLKRVCNYYRPYDMGFGYTEPQQIIRNPDGTIDIDAMKEAVMDELGKRLPYQFKLYNIRARAQKCAYWDQDTGSDFLVSTVHDGVILSATFQGDGQIFECKCPDDASKPYRTRDLSADALPIVKRVWSSEANTIVCNGAKPECPCYTGEWKYCIDDCMHSGMKITAEQIMELRFWMRDWSSQEEYDKFFEELPGNNPDDPTTAAIYTYEKLEALGTEPSDTILLGKKVEMCMPALPGAKEFDTDTYLTYASVKYPSMLPPVNDTSGNSRGTTTPTQVSFPTLIRDIEDLNIIPLDIIYPYITDKPYDKSYGCDQSLGETPCIKRSCEVDTDSIFVMGTTVRYKKVTCYNLSYFSEYPRQVIDFYSVGNMLNEQPEMANTFYNSLERFFDSAHFQDSTGTLIQETYADQYGFFNIGPVKLKYSEINILLVVVDLSGSSGDQPYEFRKVNVWPHWAAGMAIQTNYTRKMEDGYYVDLGDQVITPPGNAEVDCLPLFQSNKYGLRTEPQKLVALDEIEVITQNSQYTTYGYCVKKYTAPTAEIETWLRMGSYGLVWLDIQDYNINYLFEWGIVEADMEVYAEDENGERYKEETVEMEVIFPSISEYKRRIPRGAVLLQPKDGVFRWFRKTGDIRSVLKVSYYYHYISDNTDVSEDEEVVWPDIEDEDSAERFSGSSLEIEQQGDSHFLIKSINNRTARIGAYFVDEEGALASVFTTKLLVDIPRVFARSVEIDYSWKAEGERFILQPERGFSLDYEPPKSDGPTEHTNRPLCGDHEFTPLMKQGPMWFPYGACEKFGAYDIYQVGVYCTLPYDDVPREDMRAQGPDKYYALTMGEASIAACANDYIYAYENMNTPYFTGSAAIVPYVNETYYAAMDYDLPPFGNTSRGYVERFLSTDRVTYQSYDGTSITFKSAWMPKVPDKVDFNFTFNSVGFDRVSGDFTDISQINYLMANRISEEADVDSRYSFDEIIEVRKEGRVAYPSPVVEDDERSTPFYCFYKWKNEDIAWVWQEYWQDIERDRADTGKLEFVTFLRPEYQFDMYKAEHRLIAEEGLHTITYKAPVIEDGEFKTYPSIQLDNGPERYFEVDYDSYDTGVVDWRDENSGAVDGSGGETEGEDGQSIYEKTSDEEVWAHDPNTIFDENASESEDEAIEAETELKYSYDSLTEEWSKKVYNRGIIANLTKDRLKYLPYEEKDWDCKVTWIPNDVYYNKCGKAQGEYRWILSSKQIKATFDESACPSSLSILTLKGTMTCNQLGTNKLETTLLCKPGVKVVVNGTTLADTRYVIPTQADLRNRSNNLYQIELDFPVTPKLMINPTDVVDIYLTVPEGYGALIVAEDHIRFKRAEYVDVEEVINVWERKYQISTGEFGTFNLNGPEEPCKPRFGFLNGGIYWPKWLSSPETIDAQDKLRCLFGGAFNSEREDIDTSAILTKEYTEQLRVYEEAYNEEDTDEYTYSISLPPVTQAFFTTLGGVSAPMPTSFKVESDKFKFENHIETAEYVEVELWQPGGHVFEWNRDQKQNMKCYEIGPIEEVYKVQFVHRHGGGEWAEEAGNAFQAWSGVAKRGYLIGKEIVNRAQGIKKAHAGVADLLGRSGVTGGGEGIT